MMTGKLLIKRAILPLISCVVLVFFRLHSFDLPLETDEANYAYIAARLLEGGRLYVDVWDHQPPGIFMLFAGVIAAFGDSPDVFRILAIAFSTASLFFLYSILRRLSGRPAAILGAILFSVVSSDPGTGGEGVNREIYMNTLILAAWWLVLRGWRPDCDIAPFLGKFGPWGLDCRDVTLKQGYAHTLLAGLALGMASLLKTNVAVYWLLLTPWLGVMSWKRSGARRPLAVLTTLACFSAGPGIVWLATSGYFYATHRHSEFIDAVFLVNLDYAQTTGAFLERFGTFFNPPRFPHVFDSAYPLWLGAAAALAWLLSTALMQMNSSKFLVVGLSAAAYLAVCLPGRFWPHYYYLLIPPAIMALTLFIVSLLHASAQFIARRKRTSSIAVIASGIIVAVLLASEYNHYLSRRGIEITRQRYNTRDYWGRAQGENVARVTSPDDSIFVFGNDAELYYYAKRRCASRYTMITGLQGHMRGSPERRKTLINDLKASRPRVVILLFDQQPFPEWEEFLKEEYGQPVGVDLHDQRGTPIMFVLARRDSPILEIDWNWDAAQAAGGQTSPAD